MQFEIGGGEFGHHQRFEQAGGNHQACPTFDADRLMAVPRKAAYIGVVHVVAIYPFEPSMAAQPIDEAIDGRTGSAALLLKGTNKGFGSEWPFGGRDPLEHLAARQGRMEARFAQCSLYALLPIAGWLCGCGCSRHETLFTLCRLMATNPFPCGYQRVLWRWLLLACLELGRQRFVINPTWCCNRH